MRNLAKCILVLVTGACLTLTTSASHAATVINPRSEAVHHHASKSAWAGLEPNHYALTGHGLHVTYDSTGLAGRSSPTRTSSGSCTSMARLSGKSTATPEHW